MAEKRLDIHEKFFEFIKRLNLKKAEDMKKKVNIDSVKNNVEYRLQRNIAIQLLIQSQKSGMKIDLHLMKYPLTLNS